VRYHVELGGEGSWVERIPAGVLLDGAEREAHLVWLGPGEIRLTLDGSNHWVFARRMPDGWRLSLRGRTFDVRIEDERSREIREMADRGAPDAGPRELRAPMSGLVVRVLAEPGQRVVAGDSLVVVEAMKMENELRVEGPGTVSAVAVRAGETVDRDDLLVTFEPGES